MYSGLGGVLGRSEGDLASDWPATGNTGLSNSKPTSGRREHGASSGEFAAMEARAAELFERSKAWAGGFDTVELSAFGEWEEATFEGTWDRLDACKAAAGREEPGALTDRFLTVGGDVFAVKAKGSGGGNGGPRVRWWLEASGIRLGLCRRAESDKMPNVFVQFGSELLMWQGVEAAVVEAERLLGILGVSVVGGLLSAMVSRADWSLDCPGLGADEMTELYLAGWYISRPCSGGTFEFNDGGTFDFQRKLTGFFKGKGDRVRVYDKELESRQHERKRAFLIEHRWGGEVPDRAARVEFQLRRERLKSFGIDTVAELLEKGGAVARYLVEDWFRMTAGEPDRTHTTLAKVHPLWELVVAGFVRVFGEAETAQRTKPERQDEDLVLRRMALGAAMSIAARKAASLVVSSSVDVGQVVLDVFREIHSQAFVRGSSSFRNVVGKFEEKVHEWRSIQSRPGGGG